MLVLNEVSLRRGAKLVLECAGVTLPGHAARTGFRVEQLEAPVNSFSGSRRVRLQLPRALMCPVDDKPGSRPSPTSVNGRTRSSGPRG